MLVSSVKMWLRRKKKLARPTRRTHLHKMCHCGDTSYTIEAVSSYVESHPDDALAVDKRGMTPLHRVLSDLPHRDDIAAVLIERAPGACGIKDKDGSTPLHHAARNANLVPAKILTSLLRRDPSLALDEDGNGDTPLGLYCAELEETARNAEFLNMIRSRRTATDPCGGGGGASGNSNFGEICYGPLLEEAVPFVRAVAWGDPRTSPHRDDSQSYDKIWSKMLHTTLYAVERAAYASDMLHSVQGGNKKSAKNAANARRYRFLVRAVMNQTHPRQQNGEEETAAGGDSDEQQQQHQEEQQPQVHPQQQGANTDNEQQQQQQQQQQHEQQQNDQQNSINQQPKRRDPASEVDSRGNLPLHIAASVPFLNESPGTTERLALGLAPRRLSSFSSSDENDEDDDGHHQHGGTPKRSRRPEGIIDALVRLHPSAASARDMAGLLPFEIAERLGSGWTKGGVGAMLNANRSVLLGIEEDLTQRTMPRVLSKIGRDLELRTMFDVLRERPEVLLSGGTTK